MGGTACRSRAGVRTRPETCSHARPARTLDRVTGTPGNGRSPAARVRARGLGGANAMRGAPRGSPPQHTSRARSSTSPTSPIRLRAFGGRSVMPAPRGRPHPRSRADWRVRASWTKKNSRAGSWLDRNPPRGTTRRGLVTSLDAFAPTDRAPRRRHALAERRASHHTEPRALTRPRSPVAFGGKGKQRHVGHPRHELRFRVRVRVGHLHVQDQGGHLEQPQDPGGSGASDFAHA